MTEIGRSTRETGRFELSASAEPIPILDKIAFAIDFLTPRATICFCKSDLALAEPFLSDVVSLGLIRSVPGIPHTGTIPPQLIWLYLEQHCRHLLSMQPAKAHTDGIINRGSWSSGKFLSQRHM